MSEIAENPNHTYRNRVNLVIDYIAENLDKSFSLEELSSIALFSPYHFHRVFVAVIGESVSYYTSRLRLEKAARLLKFSTDSISTIAYRCGFSSPSTFSRSFKQQFKISPSQFRKSGNLENSKICKEYFPIQEYLVPMSLEEKKLRFPITIKERPKRTVAYIRVLDSYREGVVIEAFRKLVSWAKSIGKFEQAEFFGMSLDDPLVTPQAKYRYEACFSLDERIELIGSDSIQIMQLPKCLYATTKVSGGINLVATAISFMFNDWLIRSEFEPEHQYGLEKFLDKKNICNWEKFDLELYIPIKPLKKLK